MQEWSFSSYYKLTLLWTLHCIVLFLHPETKTGLYFPQWIYAILTQVNVSENKFI